ncbi:kinase-like domain-containing protein [Cladorrhinum sp. PSN332]|nr:kinase-like domain-containing protein [Cladorrhinum sp. PSN332]
MVTPHISSWDDLLYVSEEVDAETDTLKYTMFAAVNSEDTLYYGELPLRKADIAFEQLTSTLRPIPDADIYADWPSGSAGTPALTLTSGAQCKVATVFYIKRPGISLYDAFKRHGVAPLLGKTLLEEAHTMEFLSKHPHPNIIQYHGCLSQRGFLTGIVFDCHSCGTLQDFLQQGLEGLDKQTFMDKLESAILHLHSLGFAHNDLNPANVLVEEETKQPVLIDFGSARPVGEALGTSRGTSGWIEGKIQDYTTSRKENDLFALRKMRAWIEEPTF